MSGILNYIYSIIVSPAIAFLQTMVQMYKDYRAEEGK